DGERHGLVALRALEELRRSERADRDVDGGRPFVQEIGRDPCGHGVDARYGRFPRLRRDVHRVEGHISLPIANLDLAEDGRAAAQYAEADLDSNRVADVDRVDVLAFLVEHADGQEPRKVVAG